MGKATRKQVVLLCCWLPVLVLSSTGRADLSGLRRAVFASAASAMVLFLSALRCQRREAEQRVANAAGLMLLTRAVPLCRFPPVPLRRHCSAAARLSAWLYGTPENDPPPPLGAAVVHLQVPDAVTGRHIQWGVAVHNGAVYVAFRGSTAKVYDWVENAAFQLRHVATTGQVGSLYVHSGFWTAVEGEVGVLADKILAARQTLPEGETAPLVVCGHSKGGANALAFGALVLMGQGFSFQGCGSGRKR
eukprot:Hpha_TRINITY_DN30378_c0_g1::TRINITY_DN30378_c0_g1_i2::g.147119::m.147119